VNILKKIFGNRQVPPQKAPEHAVIVHFFYGKTDLEPIFILGDTLELAVTKAGAGEYDGNEIAEDGSDGYLYLYGPDADQLFAIVRPILESADFIANATVTLRYGPPASGVTIREVKIGS
jgi:hypothetical protein